MIEKIKLDYDVRAAFVNMQREAINRKRQYAATCNCPTCQSQRQLRLQRKQVVDAHLRKAINSFWNTARQNTINRETEYQEYQKTVRLLDLCKT